MQGEDWFRTTTWQLPAGEFLSKPGVRGHPGLPPGADTILKTDFGEAGSVLDASGTAGLGALAARSQGLESHVFEASAAALGCALKSGAAQAGLPWDAPPGQPDTVLLQPQADRGNARVELEILSAASRLATGRLLLLNHRDAGAKRFEKLAASLFASAEVIRRDKGWRLLDCRNALPSEVPPTQVEFEAAGLQLEATRGTFAAGKLDPGTRQLLEALGEPGWLAGRKVLDLGCGYGLLALVAALAGALVSALDDDLAAVRSAEANARRLALSDRIRVLHSDLDAGLERADRFDTVLMNPPFHVGKGVRLDLPRAFIATARRRLAPGGELWLVANRALPYEPLLADWRKLQTVRDAAGFKVLRAVR